MAAAITFSLFGLQPVTQGASASLITVLDYQYVYVLVAVLGLLLAANLRRTRSALSASA